MKDTNRFISILLLFFFIGFKSIKAQTKTDPIFNSIYNLNFNSYVNKPVDSLLSALPNGYTRMKLFGHITTDRVHYLAIEYPGGTEIYIQVKKYVFMNPYDINRNWNINLYKMEELNYVTLLNPNYNFTVKEVCGY